MESLRYLISEWLESELPSLVEREVEIEEIPKIFTLEMARAESELNIVYMLI